MIRQSSNDSLPKNKCTVFALFSNHTYLNIQFKKNKNICLFKNKSKLRKTLASGLKKISLYQIDYNEK